MADKTAKDALKLHTEPDKEQLDDLQYKMKMARKALELAAAVLPSKFFTRLFVFNQWKKSDSFPLFLDFCFT